MGMIGMSRGFGYGFGLAMAMAALVPVDALAGAPGAPGQEHYDKDRFIRGECNGEYAGTECTRTAEIRWECDRRLRQPNEGTNQCIVRVRAAGDTAQKAEEERRKAVTEANAQGRPGPRHPGSTGPAWAEHYTAIDAVSAKLGQEENALQFAIIGVECAQTTGVENQQCRSRIVAENAEYSTCGQAVKRKGQWTSVVDADADLAVCNEALAAVRAKRANVDQHQGESADNAPPPPPPPPPPAPPEEPEDAANAEDSEADASDSPDEADLDGDVSDGSFDDPTSAEDAEDTAEEEADEDVTDVDESDESEDSDMADGEEATEEEVAEEEGDESSDEEVSESDDAESVSEDDGATDEEFAEEEDDASYDEDADADAEDEYESEDDDSADDEDSDASDEDADAEEEFE
jgi:hypothetical protein